MAEAIPDFQKQPEMSGWLFKWTNYIRGYQKRWFVLSGGLLSYYRNQEEMSHTCRGTLSLQGATIVSNELCTIVISNGETFHIKALTEADKLKWVVALESARDIADAEELNKDHTQFLPSLASFVGSLGRKFDEVRRCNSLVYLHGAAVQESLSMIETSCTADDVNPSVTKVNESTALFRATTSAMVKACSEYLDLAEHHSSKWTALFENHSLQRNNLPSSRDSLLYQDGRSRRGEIELVERTSDDGTVVFYDCEDSSSVSEMTTDERFSLILPRVDVQMYSVLQAPGTSSASPSPSGPETRGKRKRRTQVPERPPGSANLWSIIKNCIGKDLTRIPVPASWCEPLSLLQRLTEDLEYSQILDVASRLTDPGEQLAHVAGFAVSSYSTTVSRTGKPFNPLLGETYECDRTDDMGWRSIAEQVSHHPPISAFYSESNLWEYWQQQSMASKFRGKYMQITPIGEVHLKFKSGAHYSWQKVTTNINNIIIGKLWIDQEGEMTINCHTNGFKCTATFFPLGMFNRDSKRVRGTVYDSKNKPLWNVYGSWEEKMVITRVSEPQKGTSSEAGEIVIWQRQLPPANLEKCYNFTVFACQLNEMEENVAPTDSRKRPDQRFLEEGNFDQAEKLKKFLEDKQRAARRRRYDNWRECSSTNPVTPEPSLGEQGPRASLRIDDFPDPYQPLWFKKAYESTTKSDCYIYTGEYWPCKKNKDWSRCPQIF